MDTITILDALKGERDSLSRAIAALEGAVGNGRRGRPQKSLRETAAVATTGKKPKRTMSVAARKKISASAKARWAKAKKAGKNSL